MGLNYRIESYPPCPTCGHVAETKHLGKSSAGWAFLFHGYPDEFLTSWKSWHYKIMSGSYLIMDEENRVVLLSNFIQLIESVKHLKKVTDDDFGEYLDEEGYRFINCEFS